jgi:D-amino-acid oxidase
MTAADEPGEDLVPETLRPGRDRDVLGPGEHAFPTKYAVRTSNLAIEPNMYMDKLVSDFMLFGGKIVIRKFDSPRDLMSLPESVIVNATGLGSKTIFNDDELVPIKGQFTICVPETEINYRVTGRLAGSAIAASMNPRSDGILIGNLGERGNWSLEPNQEVMRQNIEVAMQFFAAMRGPSGAKKQPT